MTSGTAARRGDALGAAARGAAFGTALVAALVCAAPGRAQPPAPPVDTTGLASGPFATMEMLYERTIFGIDVLRLRIRFGPGTAADLRARVDGRPWSDALADSVAAVALRARNVLVSSRFQRDVGLDRFLESLNDQLRNARERGLLTAAEVEEIEGDTRAQYAPLRDRGIREDDIMWYRIRDDRLHVVVQSADGVVLVEERVEGPERRMAVLAGYFARGSDFRDDLVRSLPTREGEGVP